MPVRATVSGQERLAPAGWLLLALLAPAASSGAPPASPAGDLAPGSGPAVPAPASIEEGSGKKAPPAKKASGKKVPGPEEGQAKSEPPAARAVADIEKDMKRASAQRNWIELGRLVEEAGALNEPAAYRALVTWALRGEDRDLELKAFQMLKDLKDPAALEVVWQEAGKSANFKTRIILLAVAYQHRQEPAAFAVLERAVRDPSRPVALTAIRWLRTARDSRSVPVLIDLLSALEKVHRGRLLYDTMNALRELTGLNLEYAADWKNYWESQRAGNAAPRARSSPTRAVPAQFFSVTIESDRILFIIDTSGSMEKKDPPLEGEKPEPEPVVPGKTVVRRTQAQKKKAEEVDPATLPQERQRLYRVKQELVRSIEALPEHVHFSVASFNNEISFLDDPPRLLSASRDNKKRAVEWVKSMEAKGETWTDTVFERAFEQLKDVDTIYLLSDGAPYRNGSALPQEKVLEEIKTLNRFIKCRIHTIGFKQAGDNLRYFLFALSQDHDGKCVVLP